MTIVLLITCVISPYSIAFYSVESFSLYTLGVVTDVLFFIDMIVIFNSAINDKNMQIIVDRKIIAIHYLKGWFTIDLLAIVPFDLII